MYSPELSQITGVATAIMMIISYFFKSKGAYLLCQSIGLSCMFFSYLFGNEYFAMIALTVSLTRTLVFFVYESRDKKAPLYWAFLFAGLAVGAYVFVNYALLNTAKPLDILYLTAQVLYAFIFRIRSIKLVRYTVIIPHGFAILYNTLLNGMLFVALSYTFELLADLYSIFRSKRTQAL